MNHLHQASYVVLLLVLNLSFTATQQNGHHFHQHSNTDLDSVQCHHNVNKVKPTSGSSELVQETRLEPSRQYLPQEKPFMPKEEAPAATFEQPNFLSVENTFVSPSLQNNFRSLFGDKTRPDNLSPSAAQNVPSNAIPPLTPRVTSDKKHSHHDDEDNLERLCNDAFHSFLCKPIKGPRKTPTGRLRPNAVVPADVLAGLSSNQDASRIRPDNSNLPSPTNNIGQAYLPPSQQSTNQVPKQTSPFKPTSTTTRKPPSQYLPPAPFVNILKEDNELPSPSNTNTQVYKPQPFKLTTNNIPTLPHECKKNSISPSPVEAKPTNDNPFFVIPNIKSTPTPFSNFFNSNPSTPLPFNTFPKVNQPSRTIAPPHDCEKSKTNPPFIANPSNNNPSFIKPYSPPTPQPFRSFYNTPTTPVSKHYTVSQYSSAIAPHDCNKTTSKFLPIEANPSNDSPFVIKPSITPTQKPPFYTSKPTSSFFNSNVAKSTTSFPQIKLENPTEAHDCNKHKQTLLPTNTNQNPYFVKPQSTFKPYAPTTFSPFFSSSTTESTKVPLPSNNIAQIVAQPQQINAVSVSPKPSSGYFYEKPSIPFPVPVDYRSNQNPSLIPAPANTAGYKYHQPRVPFPSNNVPKVVPQPIKQTTFPPFRSFTTSTAKPDVPCEHNKGPAGDLGNPTNEDLVVVKPNSGYSYEKPAVPFPPERGGGSSNEFLVSLRPSVTSTPTPTTGYQYNKPSNPLLLPNPSNIYRNVVPSSTNNNQISVSSPKPTSGYSYQKPSESFPTSINSKLGYNDDQLSLIGKAQTQVEVTARPGYSYDKPDNPFLTPESSNQNGNSEGYSYPKPEENFDIRSYRSN